MEETFADKVIAFNMNLEYTGTLPEGFRVMNPYLENPETLRVMERFYRKYYDDYRPRRFIVGINPGRYGAAVTGVPFTDTKRLESICGIRMESAYSHEISSVFVYEMIEAYGGAERFYRDFYIHSLFPLAIIRQTKDGKWVNANYYDDPSLLRMTQDFSLLSLKQQIGFGLDTAEVFVLGRKNARYIEQLNKQAHLFGRLVALDHPRYIQQYKAKEKQVYIDKYLSAFGHS